MTSSRFGTLFSLAGKSPVHCLLVQILLLLVMVSVDLGLDSDLFCFVLFIFWTQNVSDFSAKHTGWNS